ncbi:unnamed protein product, partial [Staurois parvus]
MISVPGDQCSPSSATYPCLPVHINATYQCPPELPFSVTHQCQSVQPINANQCHLSVLPSVPPISAAYQCHVSVLPFSAHQCHLPVPPHQCPSVQPISVHHCSLSVPITAASLTHIS